jgi:hypothetical protein
MICTLLIHGHKFTFKHLCWHSITKILRNGPRAHFLFKDHCNEDHLVIPKTNFNKVNVNMRTFGGGIAQHPPAMKHTQKCCDFCWLVDASPD